MRAGRVVGAGAAALAALVAWEARALARTVRFEDEHGGARQDHATLVGTGVGEPLRLVLLGDSAVDGYGLRPEEALPRQLAVRIAAATGRRVRVHATAVSGATTQDVVDRQLPLLRAAAPVDAVVVGVGVNDAVRRTSATRLRAATTALAVGLHTHAPDAVVAVLPCYDLTEARGLGPVLRRLLGVRGRRVAAIQRDVLAEHHVPVLSFDERPRADQLGADGLHPGASGVQAIADAAVAALVGPPASAPARHGIDH